MQRVLDDIQTLLVVTQKHQATWIAPPQQTPTASVYIYGRYLLDLQTFVNISVVDTQSSCSNIPSDRFAAKTSSSSSHLCQSIQSVYSLNTWLSQWHSNSTRQRNPKSSNSVHHKVTSIQTILSTRCFKIRTSAVDVFQEDILPTATPFVCVRVLCFSSCCSCCQAFIVEQKNSLLSLWEHAHKRKESLSEECPLGRRRQKLSWFWSSE